MSSDLEAAAAPLYRRVVEALRREILTGALAPGARLPTEEGLCRRFGVSRHTVREALRRLREERLVTSRQGAGSMVAPRAEPPLYVHDVASVEELLQYATETRYEAGSSRFVIAQGALAERLDCPPGTRWLRVEGFRYAPAVPLPLCWPEVFVHAVYGRVGEALGQRPGPVFALIEEMYGERVTEIEQTLRGAALPAAAAAGLAAKPGGAAIEIRRAYRLATGRLAEIAFNLHPAERFSYSLTLRRGAATA
jgi:DNA-binding GntR family transcriptional regulator